MSGGVPQGPWLSHLTGDAESRAMADRPPRVTLNRAGIAHVQVSERSLAGSSGIRGLPLVGEEFAGYRLLSVLGRGGMSTVYRAQNPRLGNVIALKVLDPELANNAMLR